MKKILFTIPLALCAIAGAQNPVPNTATYTPNYYPPKGGNPTYLIPPGDPPISDDWYMIGICQAPNGFHSNPCYGQLKRKCTYVNSTPDHTGGIHIDCVIVPVQVTPTIEQDQFWIHQWWIWPDDQGPCVYNPNPEDGFQPCNWGSGACWPVSVNCLPPIGFNQLPTLPLLERKETSFGGE